MKIALVIDSWHPGNGGGVAARRAFRELVNRGHELTVVSTDYHNEDWYRFYHVKGFLLPGDVKRSLKAMQFEFGWADKQTLRKAFEGVDVVHVYYPFPLSYQAIKVASQMGIPITGASHVQPQNIMGSMDSNSRLLEWFLTTMFKKTFYGQKAVRAFHSPSVFAAKWLRQIGVRTHIRVISNGIPRRYVPAKDMQRPDWFGDKFVLLYIGRHVSEKRQTLLIDAVARARHRDKMLLLLCGNGKDTELLKKKAEVLPVKPLIRYVTEEEKYQFLNTADLYVHPSIVELESLSTLEAIGCGLPALISDSPLSAAPQFALDERFLFRADDARDLADRLDYWFEHRDELKRLKREVLQMAQYYRFDRSMDEMELFFADAIEGKVEEGVTLVTTGHVPGKLPIEEAPRVVALG